MTSGGRSCPPTMPSSSSITFSHSDYQPIVSMRPISRRRGWNRFANVFCQSITPLITSDLDVIDRTYRSIHEALEPGGCLVEIHAQAARHELRSTMRLHAEQARCAGFRDVRVVRNQLLPSRAYRGPLRPVAVLAERAVGRHFGSRFVLTARRAPESPGATPAPSDGITCIDSRGETQPLGHS